MGKIEVRESREVPGQWEGTWDGQPHTALYDTREDALEATFTPYAYPGGYDVVYFPEDGGVMLCAECAKAEYQDNSDQPIYAEILHEPRSTGETCDGCYQHIVTPFCGDCNQEVGQVPGEWYISDSEEVIYCPKCMAKYRCNAHVEASEGRYQRVATRIKPGVYSLVEHSPTFGRWPEWRGPVPAEGIPSHIPGPERVFYAESCLTFYMEHLREVREARAIRFGQQ